MKIGERKGVTPAIVVLILALVAIGLVIIGFPKLTGNVMFNGVDYTDPIIITSPVDDSTFASLDEITEMTWEFNSDNDPVIDPATDVSSCSYSINGGDAEIIDCVADTTISGLVASEGENIWTVYATDNEDPGNTIEVSTTFTVGAPELFAGKVPIEEVVTIDSPIEKDEDYGMAPQVLEYTLHPDLVVAEDLVKCEYNDGTTLINNQFSCVAPISMIAQEGENIWTIYIHDQYGKVATEDVSFTYTPDLSAPFGWKQASGDGSRDRYAGLDIVYTNATDRYLIQPSIYGNLQTGTEKDFVYTSKGYAYIPTNTPYPQNIKLLRVSIDSGIVENYLEAAISSGSLLLNVERDLIYAVHRNGRKVYIINSTNMSIIDEVDSPTVLNGQINPVIKGNKIFYASSSSIEIFEFVSPYDIEHEKTTMQGLSISVGFTDIVGTELIAFIDKKDNRFYAFNTTYDEVGESYGVKFTNANCTQPLSEIVSKGTKLYYMCGDYGGIVVEVNATNLSLETFLTKQIYGANNKNVNRSKNSHKPAFAVNNEWIYYGNNDRGITAILISNPGAGVAGNPIIKNIGEVVSIIVSKNSVYAINSVGTLYALNASDISQELWKEDLDVVGTAPRLFSLIFAAKDRVLVLGKDNQLYKFPKTGVEIILEINESKEWVIPGGNKRRTRHYNTSGIGGTSYKVVSFNPALEGQISMNKNQDTVLMYKGEAYALTTTGKINKISLTTGKIEKSTGDLGLGAFMIDAPNNAIFGNGGQMVRKITIDDFDVGSKDVINSNGGSQDDVNCGCDNEWNKWIAESHQPAGVFVLGDKVYSFLMDRKKFRYREIERDKWGGCDGCKDTVTNARMPKINVYLIQLGTAFDYLYRRSSYLDLGLISAGEWDNWGNGMFPRKDNGLNNVENAMMRGVSQIDGTNNLAILTYHKISVFNTLTDTAEKYIDITDGCALVSEIISKEDILYFICSHGGEDRFKRVSVTDDTTIQLTMPAKLNTRNAFAMVGDVILYGGQDGSLYEVDTGSSPLQMTTVMLTNGDDENINTITAVNDLIYIGTEKGFIYALDSDTLEEVWSKDVTLGLGPITSIVIPAEDSMMAVGGINDLYLFGEALENIIPGCGNGICDVDYGETFASCPTECPDPNAEQEESGDSEDPSRSDPSTNCKRTYDDHSFWRDTDESSENDCKRDGETCCPRGQACKEFDNEEWKCIYDGELGGCSDYQTPEDCQEYDSWVAFDSVNLNQGEGFCGSIPELGSYYTCKCFWDPTKAKCEAGFEKIQIQSDGSEVVTESCQLSCDEGECIGGIKTVTCSAIGGPSGVCSGTSTQTGCQLPTEIPFFTLMNALVAAGILAGFYILTRKH